jgi:hypothetical protein
MQQTLFKPQELFRKELSETNNKLLKIIDDVSLALSKELHPIKKDSYHFLTDILFPDTRVEKTLYASLISCMQKCELTSAKSSYVSLLYSCFLMRELFKHSDLLDMNETLLNDMSEKSYAKVKALISKHTKITTEQILNKEIDSICENEVLADIIKEALRLSGLEGKIHIEDSKSSNYMIEMKNGYSFKVNPFKFFLTNGLWQENNVKVLTIDGMIEKVSELNSILNSTMETKLPMVIIAHGFSEEVVATLKANRDRGILNVMPVRMFSDVESLNVINDISVVCGGDVVSCVKGEQVQFISYDFIPTVQKVRCTATEFVIENAKTIGNVHAHIKSILKKREDNRAVEDICNLLDNRIKSLFSHAVTIHLPNLTKTEKDETKVKLDIALRACKTLLTHGTVNIDNVIEDLESAEIKTEFDKIFLITLKNTRDKLLSKEMPTLSLFLGTYLSTKSTLMLLTSKGFVENLT